MAKPRARELGLPLKGTPGPLNAITDVPGVAVGYLTLDGTAENGKPIKTGVTAVIPRSTALEPQPVWAGVHALNGNGEMTGTHWIEHGGYFVGPVCITNSHSVGMVHHAATRWIIERYNSQWQHEHLWAMPVVAETYDGVLNDINGQHITQAHALQALANATTGPIAEGNVGGGNGMICYGFKGGTGTASRQVSIADTHYTLGALVQANHGQRSWLKVCGVPVGEQLQEPLPEGLERERGSIIVLLATDAPMLPHQLKRLAQRAGLGIAQTGTPGGNNSGDIFLAFSVANPQPVPQLAASHLSMQYLNDEYFDQMYLAAVQAVDEAILNAMLAATDAPMHKPQGLCKAINGPLLQALVQRHHPKT